MKVIDRTKALTRHFLEKSLGNYKEKKEEKSEKHKK